MRYDMAKKMAAKLAERLGEEYSLGHDGTYIVTHLHDGSGSVRSLDDAELAAVIIDRSIELKLCSQSNVNPGLYPVCHSRKFWPVGAPEREVYAFGNSEIEALVRAFILVPFK